MALSNGIKLALDWLGLALDLLGLALIDHYYVTGHGLAGDWHLIVQD